MAPDGLAKICIRVGANRIDRRPVAAAGGAAIAIGIVTWFAVVWLIGPSGDVRPNAWH